MSDVLGYLQSKGLNPKRATAREVHLPCFLCGEADGKRGRLYINVDPGADIPGLFKCFLCDARGSLVSIKRHFGDSTDEQEEQTHERYEIFRVASAFYHEQLGEHAETFAWLRGPERNLTFETLVERQIGYAAGGLYGFLRERGFDFKDILATGLIYEVNGRVADSLYDMVTIPYLVNGNCVMIRGRAFPYTKGDTKPKYKTCGGNSSRLYNTDVMWKDHDEIVLAEGEFDTMAIEQLGFPSAGVPGANTWQDSWDDYLTDVKRVWLVFDPDKAGDDGVKKLKDRFGPKIKPIKLEHEGVACDISDWIAKGNTADDFRRLQVEASVSGILVTVDQARNEHAELQGLDGLKFGCEELDHWIRPGLLPSQVMIPLAKSGCMAGDTEIAVNRAGKGFKISISKMYERWVGKPSRRRERSGYSWDRSIPTYVQRADGSSVRLGEVSEVWESGIKRTYTVTTNTGRSVRATDEHPFLTSEGWKRLDELVVGSGVLVNAGRSRRGRIVKPQYHWRGDMKFHPYAGNRDLALQSYRVPFHRLVVEAQMNVIDIDELIRRCRQGGVEGLRFLDPAEFAVHHIDHDSLNNDPDNLKVLTHAEHAALHAAEGTTNNVLEQVSIETVVSVVPFGEEMTYDISMLDEPHNFMANGFAVHNTGKTVWLLNVMQQMSMVPGQENLKFLFVSLEQTRGEWYERARRIFRFHNLQMSDRDCIEYWRDRLMIIDKNMVSQKELMSSLDDYEYRMGGPPDVVMIDYLGYWARGFKGEAYQRTSDAVMALKAIAKERMVPIIAPHQVSRIAKYGEEPDADAARDAGVVEETADFVFILWSADALIGADVKEKTGIVNMKIAKSRHGGRGIKVAYQFAPISLAMVPIHNTTDAAVLNRARSELVYEREYRDQWEQVVYRHRTGFQGMLEPNPGIQEGML